MKKYTTLDELMATLPAERQATIKEKAQELALEYELSKIREDLEFSQQELAKALGISQPAVAQMEQRGNEIKLATLKRYIETMGGKLSLTVQMPSGDVRSFAI